MATRPNGTLTRVRSTPLASTRWSSTRPTGSGSSASFSKPAAMPSTRSGVSSRRSSRPAEVPASRAADISSSLAATMESTPVAQCCGHGAHGLLALLIARRGKRGRRCLGGNGKIVDIRGYIDRHGRPFLLEVCNHGSRFAHGLARGGRIGQPETPQRTEDSHGPHHFVPRPRPLRRGPQHRRPP